MKRAARDSKANILSGAGRRNIEKGARDSKASILAGVGRRNIPGVYNYTESVKEKQVCAAYILF